MSLSSARIFLDKLMAEEELGLRLAGELSRKRMELIQEAGFDFTEQELEQAKSALSPGALGHVAGWLCEIPTNNPSARGRCCSGGLWH
jgi:predicted ribosomally synthesized peptide with nif11-like leader